MANFNEFMGETKEAVSTLKTEVSEIKKKLGDVDKKIWLILLVVVMTFLEKTPDIKDLIGSVLAFGR